MTSRSLARPATSRIRRNFLAMLAFAGSTAMVQADEALLRWVVPFPPGGGSDLSTRIVAKHVSETLRRPIVVENKPGAATMVAAQEVARSKPDGNTILTAGMSTLTLNPGLYPRIAYQPEKDFAHVSTLVQLPIVLVVHPSNPSNTLQELVQWLRERGDRASYASPGSGTPHHVTMALWLEKNNLQTVHVPYKSMPNSLQELAGGQFEVMFGDVSTAAPLIKAGRLKAIAVPSRTRSHVLPNIPTFAQAGQPYEASAWQGVVMPAGTPPAMVDRLSAAVRSALAEPAIANQLANQGMEPMGSTPEEFAAYASSERQRWLHVIRANHIAAH